MSSSLRRYAFLVAAAMTCVGCPRPGLPPTKDVAAPAATGERPGEPAVDGAVDDPAAAGDLVDPGASRAGGVPQDADAAGEPVAAQPTEAGAGSRFQIQKVPQAATVLYVKASSDDRTRFETTFRRDPRSQRFLVSPLGLDPAHAIVIDVQARDPRGRVLANGRGLVVGLGSGEVRPLRIKLTDAHVPLPIPVPPKPVPPKPVPPKPVPPKPVPPKPVPPKPVPPKPVPPKPVPPKPVPPKPVPPKPVPPKPVPPKPVPPKPVPPKPVPPAPRTGWISGGVRDLASVRPLAGARVTLTPGGKEAFADIAGVYRFNDLPEGTYTVTGNAPGYRPLAKTVRVYSGILTSQNLALTR